MAKKKKKFCGICGAELLKLRKGKRDYVFYCQKCGKMLVV